MRNPRPPTKLAVENRDGSMCRPEMLIYQEEEIIIIF
jgi:hypothetical protein